MYVDYKYHLALNFDPDFPYTNIRIKLNLEYVHLYPKKFKKRSNKKPLKQSCQPNNNELENIDTQLKQQVKSAINSYYLLNSNETIVDSLAAAALPDDMNCLPIAVDMYEIPIAYDTDMDQSSSSEYTMLEQVGLGEFPLIDQHLVSISPSMQEYCNLISYSRHFLFPSTKLKFNQIHRHYRQLKNDEVASDDYALIGYTLAVVYHYATFNNKLKETSRRTLTGFLDDLGHGPIGDISVIKPLFEWLLELELIEYNKTFIYFNKADILEYSELFFMKSSFRDLKISTNDHGDENIEIEIEENHPIT